MENWKICSFFHNVFKYISFRSQTTYSFVKCSCSVYFFLSSANLICRGTDISKYFRVLWTSSRQHFLNSEAAPITNACKALYLIGETVNKTLCRDKCTRSLKYRKCYIECMNTSWFIRIASLEGNNSFILSSSWSYLYIAYHKNVFFFGVFFSDSVLYSCDVFKWCQ